ncbi:MAG: hypothetical protein IH946_11885, partial [Bacteroidetes bacterium]|nr:hypothetical protein [Bacteroidota bacterium]
MKNVLILVPTMKAGGAERFASSLSMALDKNNKVYVCFFDEAQGKDFEVAGEKVDMR